MGKDLIKEERDESTYETIIALFLWEKLSMFTQKRFAEKNTFFPIAFSGGKLTSK